MPRFRQYRPVVSSMMDKRLWTVWQSSHMQTSRIYMQALSAGFWDAETASVVDCPAQFAGIYCLAFRPVV